jgi:hypothetical protein
VLGWIGGGEVVMRDRGLLMRGRCEKGLREIPGMLEVRGTVGMIWGICGSILVRMNRGSRTSGMWHL